MRAALLTIGNEILLGETVNTNLSYIGKKLASIGISLEKEITVKDKKEDITNALNDLWNNYDIVISTGGLGPTNDDISKKTIAEYFKKPLYFNLKIWEQIQFRFIQKGRLAPNINRNQAEVPKDFVPLRNEQGTAPGLCFREGNKFFFALPGVPYEMKHIIESKILIILQKAFKTKPIKIIDIFTKGLPESEIAERLDKIDIPEDVSLAFLPQGGRVNLRVYGVDEVKNNKVKEQIVDELDNNIWGIDDCSIEEKIHNLLIEKKLTISFAESCTGGLIQKMLTDFSGSSSYLKGGVVTYSNEAKENLLKVDNSILEKHGAVSAETAEKMAEGCHSLFKTDIACGVTGIAGPDGGTPGKPVGTVYISIKFNNMVKVEKLQLHGNRERIRKQSAENLLFLVLEMLK